LLPQPLTGRLNFASATGRGKRVAMDNFSFFPEEKLSSIKREVPVLSEAIGWRYFLPKQS